MELQVGDVVWLYTPVVRKGNTRKFSSFWKGPYTIIDRVGPVNYKLQLVGGTQSLVVHRNHIKLCYNAEQYSSKLTTAASNQAPLDSTVDTQTGVAGYVDVANDAVTQPDVPDVSAGHPSSSSRPVCTHRPPLTARRHNSGGVNVTCT